MTDYRLCAFADEASAGLQGQIEALHRNSIRLIEIRNADGKSVVDMNNDELRDILKRLDAAEISVWSIGSSLGKTRFDETVEHQRRFERSLAAAKILGAKNIRMFSFFVDEETADFRRDEIIAELSQMTAIAAEQGIQLCHENEKGIYGSTASRTMDLLMNVPNLRGIFDPANFIQCGENPGKIFDDFMPYIDYIHVKDALAEDGSVVPAGEGDGDLVKVLDSFHRGKSGRVLTLEPHLFQFAGLSNLQDAELKHKQRYADSGEAFDVAANALKKLLDERGYTYE